MTEETTNDGETANSVFSRRQVLQGTAAAGAMSLLSAAASASGTTELVVRAEAVEVPLLAASSSPVEELKATAEESQKPIVEYAERTDGLSVKNQFWLANALLLEVDTEKVSPERLLTQKGVTEVHPNYQMEIPDPEASRGSAAASDVTYGLDQMDAPEVWDSYDARGQGTRIAVLDTGVDPDHPDIDITPENFAEFDSDGNEVDSDPHDSAYHGTHVSGTATGGDASGTAIGVAPEAELLHGLILPEGGGSFTQIIAGIQWAVEEDADVINMSLGATGYYAQMIEPVRNAQAAGTMVVAAAGNDGEGTTGTPGNVYDSFAAGASNANGGIANFSSGEQIDTAQAWEGNAPDDWPDTYIVPDAAAPGVDVYSSYPVNHAEGPYNSISGTSMASPHITGLVGLMESAGAEDVTPEQIHAALTTTARNPEGDSPEQDTRYGHGIVDAVAAVGRVAADSGVSGRITDADGNPVEGATVRLGDFPTETDANGEYRLRAASGTYELSVDAFGHDGVSVTVEVADEFLTQDFTLADDLAVTTVTDQPDGLEAGESFDVELQVANAESLTVERVGGYDGDASLAVNGETAAFGEAFSFDGTTSGVVTLTVETGPEGSGDLELEATLAGLGETVTVTTGSTPVYAESTLVGIVEATGGYGAEARTVLENEMHPRYRFSVLEPQAALDAAKNREHDAYVVQSLGTDDDLVSSFVEVAAAPEVGVVYLDQYGEGATAVSDLSDATDNPADTFGALVRMAAPPVEYAVDRDHPALDGLADPGESVAVTQPDPVSIGLGSYVGGFHTYFENYDGPVASAILARTGVNFVTSGPGLAVDDLSRVVLASSLGFGPLVDRSMFTDDGKALLANLVAHAAETPPVEVTQVPPEQVAPGESVTAALAAEDLVEVEIDVSGLEYLSEGDLTLTVDGERVAFGEAVSYDEYDGTVEVSVSTPSSAIGEFALDTRFVTLDDGGDEVETAATLGATTVYESPIRVPDQLDDLQAAVDFVNPGDAVVVGDGTYALSSDEVPQTGLYVGTPGITIRGAEGATAEVIHSEDVAAPDVVNVDADDVTLKNLSVNVLDGEIDPKNLVGQAVRINEYVSGATVENVTAAGTSGVFLDAEVSDVRVEGARVVESPIGVGTDLSGGPVENVTVTDLTFEEPYFFGWAGVYLENASEATVTNCDITYSDGYDGGIVLTGAFSGSVDNTIADNTITGPDVSEEPSSGLDIGVYTDGAEVTVANNHVADAYRGFRVAEYGFGADQPDVYIEDNVVENAGVAFKQFGDHVALRRNEFEAETGLDLSGGYFGLDADSVVARNNDLSATEVPFVGEPGDGYSAPEGPYDVRQNYLGERSYDDTVADGELAYEPFLTVPPEETDPSEPTDLAVDLTLDPGETYALGIPGPTDRTVYEILGADDFREFAGTVEYRDANSGKWKTVRGQGRLRHVESLEAFRVTPAEGVRAVVDFRKRAGTPPGLRDSDPTGTDLERGWNVVAAPTYGEAGAVFDSDAVAEVEPAGASPGGQLADADREAFTAYRVRATERTRLSAGLDAYAPTTAGLYESLGLDPAIHDPVGPNATSGRLQVTVADVLDAVPDDEAADAVARLVGDRIARRVEDTDDPEAVVEEVESVSAKVASKAPSSASDLVQDAARRAAVEAVRAAFGATVAEEETDFDTEAASVVAEKDGASASSLRFAGALSDD